MWPCAAPDSVDLWLNGFYIATMALFTAETVLDLTCRCGRHCAAACCRAAQQPLSRSQPCPPPHTFPLAAPAPRSATLTWLAVFLDSASTLSILFAITWFDDAMGVKPDGTTSDAARAVRTVRLVRLITVLELTTHKLKKVRAPGRHWWSLAAVG